MRIALVGTGKMGAEIERLAVARSWEITTRQNRTSSPPTRRDFTTTDAVLHFASPSSIPMGLRPWLTEGVPVVLGTTGWNDRLPAVRALVETTGGAIVHASNFSIGVNLFFHIVRRASQLMNLAPEYDAAIHETHHAAKADAPSGTALTLGDILLKEFRRKSEIVTQLTGEPVPADKLLISSSRVGSVAGTHSVVFDSPADFIEMTHTARNRSGFALGALIAAEWICGRKGLFTMNDVIEDLFQK